MEEATRKLGRILKENGYSLTVPRTVVFKYLYGKEPVSVGVISRALVPSVNRASIYRTVSLFQDIGIIKRHNTGWKYKIELSDMFSEHHHHFTCLSCGSITKLNASSLEGLVEKLAKHQDFVVTEHQVELQGYCSRCKRDSLATI